MIDRKRLVISYGGNSGRKSLIGFCSFFERLVIVTPDLQGKSAPEGPVDTEFGLHNLLSRFVPVAV